MLQKVDKLSDFFNSDEQMKAVQNYVQNLFMNDPSGHDYHHMRRVAQMARVIASKENANPFICQAGGWLHDVGDEKLFKNPDQTKKELRLFLQSIHMSERNIRHIFIAIQDVSFKKGRTPKTIEGKIIQDADRLDAIGAIGIARVFAFGGANGQQIYNKDKPSSIKHFYEKLLHLKDAMHTQYAKKMAHKRHQFMQRFLKQFYQEWTII